MARLALSDKIKSLLSAIKTMPLSHMVVGRIFDLDFNLPPTTTVAVTIRRPAMRTSHFKHLSDISLYIWAFGDTLESSCMKHL